MKILVINSGSSSIKYQFFNMTSKEVIAKGLVEKIGLKDSLIKHKKQNNETITLQGDILDHQTGIEYLLGILRSKKHGCIKNLSDIDAVGHRIAHGAENFNSSALITKEVIKAVENAIELAPLHNPANLKGITAIQKLLPEIKQVAVFDTAFHQTMPDYAFIYGIPYEFYQKYSIRRYGFHGTSHKYVAKRACEILNLNFENQKIITCHLGNGASIAAINKGISIDTSMGMTPIEGLIMGSRAGDLDLGIYNYIINKENITPETAYNLVNKHSGMLGISGISSDMREIENAAENNNERAKLALKMYSYKVKKYIGAYTAAMNGIDILVFTGGIGENDINTRYKIAENLNFFGIEIDKTKNNIRGKETIISKDNAKVKTLIVPTNEELVIAQDTIDIITKEKKQI